MMGTGQNELLSCYKLKFHLTQPPDNNWCIVWEGQQSLKSHLSMNLTVMALSYHLGDPAGVS